MSKVLRVEMDSNMVWDVPTHARATYFAERDPDTTNSEESEYSLGSNFELVDWARNNMNWLD